MTNKFLTFFEFYRLCINTTVHVDSNVMTLNNYDDILNLYERHIEDFKEYYIDHLNNCLFFPED